jgi:hypothetical protein
VSLVVVRYTLLRLGLFAVVLAALFVAGARGVLLIGLTVVVSLALSYLLLRKQRDQVAEVIAERVAQPRRRGGGVDEAVEDAEDDARRGQADSASPRPTSRP